MSDIKLKCVFRARPTFFGVAIVQWRQQWLRRSCRNKKQELAFWTGTEHMKIYIYLFLFLSLFLRNETYSILRRSDSNKRWGYIVMVRTLIKIMIQKAVFYLQQAFLFVHHSVQHAQQRRNNIKLLCVWCVQMRKSDFIIISWEELWMEEDEEKSSLIIFSIIIISPSFSFCSAHSFRLGWAEKERDETYFFHLRFWNVIKYYIREEDTVVYSVSFLGYFIFYCALHK